MFFDRTRQEGGVVILNWMQGHEVLLWWMGIFSVLMFVGSLIIVPMIVVRIPADYFLHRERIRDRKNEPNYIFQMTTLVLKNIFGLLMILLGLGMLVTPGPGIVAIVLGVMLMNFPGKWALQEYIIAKPAVLRALNWMRSRAGRPPLEVEQRE